MMRMLAALAVCSFVGLASLGCGQGGPELGQVTGTVTMDGKPLPNALVTFIPQENAGLEGSGTSTGVTDEQGNYKLLYQDRFGAVLGKHKVTITSLQKSVVEEVSPDVSSDSAEYEQYALGGDASAYNQAKVAEPIPAKYNAQSQLIEEVKSGNNVINFDLQSSG